MSDVVSRLLAAIDEREEFARDAMQRPWLTSDNYVEDADGAEVARFNLKRDAQHAGLNGPLAVLRLCQSHRDIVAEWQRNKQIADQLQHEVPQGDAYLVAKGIVAGLWASVVLVARGYGVEDGETK